MVAKAAAKHELNEIRRLDRAVERRLMDIEQIQSKINRVTTTLNKINVQGGQRSNLADSIDRLIHAQRRANEAVDAFIAAKEIAINRIDQIDDPLLSDILHARYVRYLDWKSMAQEFCFSEKYITGNLHSLALIAYQDILDVEISRST